METESLINHYNMKGQFTAAARVCYSKLQCLLAVVLIVIFLALLPVILQTKPFVTYFSTPNIDNYYYYVKNINNQEVCKSVLAPLVHPSRSGVVLLIGLVDITEIQDYLETRSRVRLINSQCHPEAVFNCIDEMYYTHGIAVHMESPDELKQYYAFKPARVIYLKGNPFTELNKLENRRLHRAGFNDRDHYTWEFLSQWSIEAGGYTGDIITYDTLTVDVLRTIFEKVTENRDDITKVDCTNNFTLRTCKTVYNMPKKLRETWCDNFNDTWDNNVFGPCVI